MSRGRPAAISMAMLAAFAWFGPSLNPASALSLCVDSNDWIPYTLGEGDGTLQTLARLAAARQGLDLHFVSEPWRRCQIDVEKGNVDGLIAESAESHLAGSFAYPRKNGKIDPSLAVAAASIVLLKRSGSPARWDGKTLSGYDGSVAHVLGYSDIDVALESLGLPYDSSSHTTEQAVKEVLAGRTDVMATYQHDAAKVLESPAYAGKLELLEPPLGTYRFYIVFNRETYQRRQAEIDAYWEELRRTQHDPAYLQSTEKLRR